MIIDYEDQTLIRALVKLITITDDSVLLKRSGSFEKTKEIIYKFKHLDLNDLEAINDLTNYCIENNLSFVVQLIY